MILLKRQRVERVAVAGKRTAVKELAEKSVQVLMGIDECTVLGLMHTDYCGFPHVHVDQWALRDACTPRAPLRGYRKFKRDMALLSAKQERERQEHLCTASPSLTFSEVGPSETEDRAECLAHCR